MNWLKTMLFLQELLQKIVIFITNNLLIKIILAVQSHILAIKKEASLACQPNLIQIKI